MDPFVPLVQAFHDRKVRFVTIGVFGANYYAHSGSTTFTTRDRDVFLPLDPPNVLAAWRACEERELALWAGDEPLDLPRDLLLAERVVERRAAVKATQGDRLEVDLTLVMEGFTFDEIWRTRRVFPVSGVDVPVARLTDIVTSKARVGRPKDRLFLATHEEALRQLMKADVGPRLRHPLPYGPPRTGERAVTHPLFERHREKLEQAVEATRTRAFFSAYPEVPSGKIYGETARDDGLAAFQARLNKPFEIDQPGTTGQVGEEISPYGMRLGVTYPEVDLDVLLPAAEASMATWKALDVEARTGICLEILHKINQRSFEFAFTVMHTTGQGFMMAFQAGGPHAQDRGLEAIAYAYQEMTRVPTTATWEKRVGRDETVTLEKRFRIVPRGVGVVIGCSTFPTWNSYPGLFASLVTGNAVVVKPHPGAILPLALTVEIARDVLAKEGHDPNLVTLAADSARSPIAKTLVKRPEVKIVDYTGGSEFGAWVEANAKQADVYTEKAGVNSIIVDSFDDMRAVTGNIAFTLCLYSGQMCTTSQNIFIPRGGVNVGGEHKTFEEVAGGIVKAVDWLVSDAKRGAEVLGAIQNERTLARIDEAKKDGGTVLREAAAVANETFPEACVRSPLVLEVDAADERLYMREMFGPIAYVVATDDTAQSIDLAARTAREHGAITCALYSTDPDVIGAAEDATADAGVPLSCNLTGSIWVNQSAAFSDFHVSGGNPAGNATLCDGAFVANRFRVVQSRTPVAQPAAVS